MGDFNSVEDYMQNAESNRNSAILNTLLENEPGMKELPNITDNDIGKYLKVKSDKSLEWAEGGTGGGVLVVHEDENGTLDKTWKEIYDADFAIMIGEQPGSKSIIHIFDVYVNMPEKDVYHVTVGSPSYSGGEVILTKSDYVTNSENGYPSYTE